MKIEFKYFEDENASYSSESLVAVITECTATERELLFKNGPHRYNLAEELKGKLTEVGIIMQEDVSLLQESFRKEEKETEVEN